MPNTKTRLCPFSHVPYHKGTMVVPPLPVIMRINARYLIESYIFTILWTSQYLSFSLFSCSKKAMYLLHKFLNIVLLPLNLVVLLFFIPPFLILKFLWSLKRSIYSENVWQSRTYHWSIFRNWRGLYQSLICHYRQWQRPKEQGFIHISPCKIFRLFQHNNLLFLFFTTSFSKYLHQSIYFRRYFNIIFILH